MLDTPAYDGLAGEHITPDPIGVVNPDTPIATLAEVIADALRKSGLIDPEDDTAPVFLDTASPTHTRVDHWCSALDAAFRVAQWLRWGPDRSPVPCQAIVGYLPDAEADNPELCGYPSTDGVCEQHHEADELERFLALLGDSDDPEQLADVIADTARSFIAGDDVRAHGPRARLAALQAHQQLSQGSDTPTAHT